MLKNKLLFVFLIIFIFNAQAQRWKKFRYEVIGGIGGTNFLGELGGSDKDGTHFARDLKLSMTRPLIDFALRYQINPHFSVKSSLVFGMLRGDDNVTDNPFRSYRNLSFRSPILEFSCHAEYWPIREKFKYTRYSLKRKKNLQSFKASKIKIYPYLFGGVGVFYFNPQAKYHGVWYDLQPLGTEGQGMLPTRQKYKRTQICIPVGIGFKFPFYRKFLIGIEYGSRITFTDYIDDVSTTYYDPKLLNRGRTVMSAILSDRSDPDNPEAPSSLKAHPSWTAPNQQRGDSRYKDSYMFLVITLIYKLNASFRGIPRF
jgi:hypothetical protein